MLHILNPSRTSASGGKSSAYKSAQFCALYLGTYAVVSVFFEPWFFWEEWEESWTADANRSASDPSERSFGKEFGNKMYGASEDFRVQRKYCLLGLTRRETMWGRRLIGSVILGSMIGLERREANRGAGIRTMSLVSLGACVFGICSSFAFEDSTQEWDASRVSAALPAGVGFLGGALIFKDKGQIKGLTTACGLWLACAVGMCCGGGLFFVGAFGVCLMVCVLRFGPRMGEAAETAEEEAAAAAEEEAAEAALAAAKLNQEDPDRGTISGLLRPASGNDLAADTEKRTPSMNRIQRRHTTVDFPAGAAPQRRARIVELCADE